MKQAAFKLVAFVVATQLVLVSGTLAACFITNAEECKGDRISEPLTYISGQFFALSASEK